MDARIDNLNEGQNRLFDTQQEIKDVLLRLTQIIEKQHSHHGARPSHPGAESSDPAVGPTN